MQTGGPADGQPSLKKGPARAVGRDLFPALARHIMHARRGGFATESLAEHERILDALDADNLSDAAKAIEQHRLFAMKRLEETPQR